MFTLIAAKRKRYWIFLLFFAVGLFHAGAEAETFTLSPNSAARALAAVTNAISAREKTAGSMHLTAGEVAELLLKSFSIQGSEASRSKLISLMETYQYLEPGENNGNFRWFDDQKGVSDKNAVEFTLRKLSLVWLVYEKQLTVQQRERFLQLLRRAVPAVRFHAVALSYTNIYLMRAWNLLALGIIFEDEILRNEGNRALEVWFTYTQNNGMAEYLSPTYYAVDLESVALISKFAADRRVRDGADAVNDLLWAHILSNWFSPSARLGGPHSRDYDVLYGEGDIRAKVQRAHQSVGEQAFDSAYDYYSWRPPGDVISALFKNVSLPIYSEFRAGLNNVGKNFTTEDFSLGTVEEFKSNPQGVPLIANLGPGIKNPQTTFSLLSGVDFYSQTLDREKDTGHRKNVAADYSFYSSQQRNNVIFLALSKDDVRSNFVLPADAEYWFDQTLVNKPAPSGWMIDPAPRDARTTVEAPIPDGMAFIRDGSNEDGVGISKIYKANANEVWDFSVSGKGGDFSLYINFYDKEYRLLGMEHRSDKSFAENTTQEMTGTAPSHTAWVKLWIYSSKVNVAELTLKSVEVDASFAGVQRLQDRSSSLPRAIFNRELPLGSTLFVKRNNVVLAIRPISDLSPKLRHELSDDGLLLNSFRLTSIDRGQLFSYWLSIENNIRSDAEFRSFRNRAMNANFHFVQADQSVGVHAELEKSSLNLNCVSTADPKLGIQSCSKSKLGAPLVVNGAALNINSR